MSVADDVKARVDIVEVVSGYVALRKSGRYFKALCPFHSEKTPSFIVNPEGQGWRCFGACATGGDVFAFIMRMERMDFGEALRSLAQRAGVELSQAPGGDGSEALYSINQAAARLYRDVLESPDGAHAVSYLTHRGVSAEARARFELGLSPDGWDGLRGHLTGLGFAVEQGVESGLLHRGEGSRVWDFFRGRLMFPIHDRQGRVVGFGARALDNSMPKYINTQRTQVFDKGSTLYGLHLAAAAIRDKNTGVVVEGYMDVIAAHQHGYANVVASMGTALTEQQVAQLRSLATNFVLALDPDAAGQEATLRSLESSWRVFERQVARQARRSVGALYRRDPLKLGVAALPAGRDPDELIREDPGEWERTINGAVPLMDYLIPSLAARLDLGTPQGKAQLVENVFPMIASMENPFEQERTFRKLAEVVGVSEAALQASVGRPRRRSGATDAPVSVSALSGDADDTVERYTLALLLARPELKDAVRDFAPECFQKSEDREIFTRWLSCSTIDDLRDSIDESLRERLIYLARNQMAQGDGHEAKVALGQCLRRLEAGHLRRLQQTLLDSEDASAPPSRELEAAISQVNARLRELFLQRVQKAAGLID